MDQSNPSSESFGALLSRYRKERNMTQQRLAEVTGVGRNTIGRWERGEFLPESKGMVLELARRLHLDDLEARHLLEASLTTLSPHWYVPFSRNPYFTGREEMLEVLHTRLMNDRASAYMRVNALQALGGMGKTQIALEYAYRHALEYSAVFWIEAETEEMVISSLLRMAELLQLPECQESEQQRVVTAVQRWLSSHSRWLLIWDNLENLELLLHFLPAARMGAILITTRSQSLGTLALGMDLPPMLPEEGMALLLRRAKLLEPEAPEEEALHLAVRWPGEHAAAAELVMIMGGLPLALDQAGAYIEETGCGLAGYLRRYTHQRRYLLNQRGEGHGTHPYSVVATLWLTCQRVASQQPAALELLRFCAFLYPDAIPEEILVAGASSLGPVLGPVVANAFHFDHALATLRAFSLVQRHPESRTLSLHRLVQVVLQEEMSQHEQAEWHQRVVYFLSAVFPVITAGMLRDTWDVCERLLPHVMACITTIPNRLQDQKLAMVLLNAADYLYERAQDEQAERLYQHALSLFERQLRSEHSLVGSSLARLGRLYRVQGKHEQAEPLFQRALYLLEQAMGPEHPDLALPLQGLATVYHELGHYEQAEQLYLRALQILEQAHGPEHLAVASALNDLGLLFRARGHYEQAEQLYQRALRIWEQALGPEHPEVARPLNNLGELYRDLGRYEQAEALCLRALRLFEQALGPAHPDGAALLDTLAAIYQVMGNDEQAELLYQRAIHLLERALGLEHPKLAFPLSGLALLRRKMGKEEEAEALYQRALQIRERHLGLHHPETAQTLSDLALLRQQQGRLTEALSLAKQAWQICSQSLGDIHPQTITLQGHSHQLVQMLGYPEEANDGTRQETDQSSIPTRSVAVRGANELVAYTRAIRMRAVTFTCTICGQTVTQQHYPSRQIKYCSQTCRAVSVAQRQQVRVARQREKRRMAREAQK